MYAGMTISVNKCTVFRNVLLKYRDPQQIPYAEHSTLNGMSSTHLSPRGQGMVRKRRHTTCKNQRGLRTRRREQRPQSAASEIKGPLYTRDVLGPEGAAGSRTVTQRPRQTPCGPVPLGPELVADLGPQEPPHAAAQLG